MRLKSKTTATLLIAVFMISIFSVAIPVSAVVTDLTVTVEPDPITEGGATDIIVGLTTTVDEDQWNLTITVTDPDGGTSTYDLSGTGLADPGKSISRVYPLHFTGATTDIAGTYHVSATAGGLTATGSFVVRSPDSEATVGLTALVEEFIPTISISVTPTSVDFGTVIQGGESVPRKSITVTNTGDVSVSVTHSIVEDEVFYASYLRGVPEFQMTSKGYLDFEIYIDLSTEFDFTGTASGTLVFWAEAVPP